MAAKMTVPRIRNHKVSEGADPLVMLTAYDAPTARMVDSAGADIILVGDSVAMVVLGYEDTLQVTIDDIAYHTAAVTRANPSAFVVADMPWMSYHVSKEETVINAAKLIRAGADAVKLEGGRRRLPMIEALVDAEIPVMGHLGLTPQSVNVMGGYKVQAKNTKAALDLVSAAKSLVHAGCFSVVLEGVPSPVAGMVTEAIDVATIGIGAGPYCDGQVLVLHDVLGIEQRVLPKFVRRYADLHGEGVKALSEFAKDVRTGKFPGDEESYQLHDDVVDEIKLYGTI
ncbi:MAG: 3-methyl-2-oxobutanoate hydroxymethyltransferase [Acidimicrobiaceae bacterium]|jgi:3-methyl-2-oxobutanoate hydroxymethyltransferase|nr:3-methyl-2-oxobutanoate hydroxymethyltransferase [Acidimicrobiaceae bacterium]MEC9034693.1 3-methyl-2-oxobutanoate hydroxymethyltransferase [Actinomycetota bacterium]|tara:strand:- start:3114 stop:3965 length:852 start_codon:yes stop_codon:yes gene_type:complete